MAAASITKNTNAVAVVVSEGFIVRISVDGELVSEIIPELWMLSRFGHHLTGHFTEKTDHDLTVVSRTQ